mmetsp:Transcript_29946/g.48380  ORF Transcript_29946/g.48380 Transcript_29946/m.48380 type:complete len:594 (+) Transcript_29946:156-1937(+)
MLIPQLAFAKAYDQIKTQAIKASPALIFVAPDCDAICANRILTELLKADQINYTVYSVGTYDDLQNYSDQLVKTDNKLRSIFLINCGGGKDVVKLFDLHDEREFTIYIVDSHRPYRLRNVCHDERVLVFDDGSSDESHYPEIDVEGSDDESGKEDNDFGDDDEAGDDTGKDADEHQNKKRRVHEENAAAAEMRKRRAEMGQYYRKGTWYGASAVGTMYALAAQIGKSRLELLWLYICGFSDQYLQERIPSDDYQEEAEALSGEIQNFKDEAAHREETSGEAVSGNSPRQQDEISYRDVLRFTLLNHWSLYESLYHSPFVFCRLPTWKEAGRKKLEVFFAKVGLSLERSKQKFTALEGGEIKRFRDNLVTYKDEYRMHDVLFKSFNRTSNVGSVWANDAVYGINALLANATLSPAIADRNWDKSFDLAVDLLKSRGKEQKELLQEGIELAIKMQRMAIQKASAIMEKRAYTLSGPFRYAMLDDISEQLVHPTFLTVLGLLMRDAVRECGSIGKASKPFLIGALKRDHYLFVGINATPKPGSRLSNHFGKWYRITAQETHTEIRQNMFDPAIAWVPRDDKDKFLDIMHSTVTLAR